MNKIYTAVIALLFTLASNTSTAGLITVVGDVNSDEFGNQAFYNNILGSSQNVLFNTNSNFYGINDIYNNYNTKGLGSLSTTLSPITANILSNVDLLVFSHTSQWNTPLSYTANELSVISQFLLGGGDLLLVAEASNSPSNFANFNGFLSGIGSSISYTGERISRWDYTQASANSLTVGQPTLRQGYYDVLTGGTTLYSLNGKTSVASEQISASVPEPSTLAIFALGLVGLASRRYKRQS